MEGQRPKPHLTRERTDELLVALGFEFNIAGQLIDTLEQRLRFGNLLELIAGAIADWADVEPEAGVTTWDSITNELEEFAEEYLVG